MKDEIIDDEEDGDEEEEEQELTQDQLDALLLKACKDSNYEEA